MARCDYCDKAKCQVCSSTYLLYAGDGKCYTSSTCPKGTYPDSTNCLSMIYKNSFILFLPIDCAVSNCAKCTASACQTCMTSYFLSAVDGLCYNKCPSGTYTSSTNCLGMVTIYDKVIIYHDSLYSKLRSM